MKQSYKVVSVTGVWGYETQHKFETQVTNLVNNGFSLVGGVSVTHSIDAIGVRTLTQALVKAIDN